MKKAISFIVALALLLSIAVCFSGCSDEEEVTTYHLETDYVMEMVSAMQVGGAVISSEDIDELFKEMEYLMVSEDGIEKSGADGNRVEGEYFIMGNRMMVTWRDGTKNEFIMEKDSLILPPEYMRIELKWTKQ